MSWLTEMETVFETTFRKMLANAGYMHEDDEFAYDTALNGLEALYGKKLSEYDSFESAVQAAEKFCKNREFYRPEEYSNVSKISVQLTFHLGKMSVTMGADRQFRINSGNERRRAFEMLMEAIRADAGTILKQTPDLARSMSNGGGGASSQTAYEERVLNIVSFEHDFTDGKHRFKVKGEPYMKFGVPVYPEVLQAMGYEDPEEQIPLGSHELEGKAHIMMNSSGNPKKVTRIDASLPF